MKFAHFFIERPRAAAVLSLFFLIVGALSYFRLPVSQYPEVVPPTIVVTAIYPGANPEVIADTVAAPIEQEVNGVEGMQYMTSQSTSDGVMTLTITFALGTDLDLAQVQVQARVAIAEPRLPEEVRRLGVVTRKTSPDLLMIVHMESPDGTYDPVYVGNYTLLHVKDVLARLSGVGDLEVFGTGEYSMRVWLDPQRMLALDLTATDVVDALKAQNIEVAGGTLGQAPIRAGNGFQLTVSASGRFTDVEQFKGVVVKRGTEGRLVRLKDVARVELGEADYSLNSYLDGKPAAALIVYQRPGSNALETADAIETKMAELAHNFPKGLGYRIVHNPTRYIAESVHAVYFTILEAAVLVVLVIILFLQTARAAIIPVIAIPVSLIGTFAVMELLGLSLNSLSLFGLVLAIGIVVDDAIVVVENIERKIGEGLDPHEAAHVTTDEVGRALIGIALVLSAVFIPTAFLGGISGQFFQQFAVTIAASTIISAINSLTLSPALGAILLESSERRARQRSLLATLAESVFRVFNRGYGALSRRYIAAETRVVAAPKLWIAVFLGLILLTVYLFEQVPRGFIPLQDRGFLVVIAELPPGASLERTDRVIRQASEVIRDVPGAFHSIAFSGFSGATYSNASNAGAIFVTLKPFKERNAGDGIGPLADDLREVLSRIKDADFYVIEPTPVRGLGILGGFKLMLQDQAGRGLAALDEAASALVGAGNKSDVVGGVFSTFSVGTPRQNLDIDRTRAEMLNVPVQHIFDALRIFLGSEYVNDFTLAGRSFRVRAQADAPFRVEPSDVGKLWVRNEEGGMVPLGSLVHINPGNGPDRVVRHNLYPTAELLGGAKPGHSSGQALDEMERLAAEKLPPGFGYEWADIAYQERLAGNSGLLVFPLAMLFVFLVLAAQYESWTLPLSIVLIVPLCLSFAILGIHLRGIENSILTQIAFVVLVGLASKNAILIVEFARQAEVAGKTPTEAALEAARLRLRPILMTSAAFIMGVMPLMLARGAGAEMRQALGTAVFGGMLGVTLFGLILTPVFYVVMRRLSGRPMEQGRLRRALQRPGT